MQSTPPLHRPDSVHRKAGRADTKRRNLRTILRLIASGGTTTRAEVARITGLTRATVSSLVSDLIADGLVAEAGQGPSLGGKPPTLIELNRSGRHLVVADLSTSPFTGTVVDLSGRSVRAPLAGPAESTHQGNLEQLLATLIDESPHPISGVGLASPGVISEDGVVIEASNLGWHNHPLAELTERAVELPVTVINDAQAIAVAAYDRLAGGPAAGIDAVPDLLLIHLGRGIGAGIILGGRIHVGSHRAAGEIGHSVVDLAGPECRCGNRGCLETVASSAAIYHTIVGRRPASIDWNITKLEDRYGADTVAAAIAEAGEAVATVVGFLINALDISLTAIAMRPGDAAKPMAAAVARSLTNRVLPALRPDLQVMPVEGEDLAMVGAGAILLQQEYGLPWAAPAD
ncbi:MAG: ROK family transcriptional regulator [Acidimicrobiia bacterium]|nr:ROK family transcriptional regulator [Acidimicrobiia bacterium]